MKRLNHFWGLLAGTVGAAVVFVALWTVSALVYRDAGSGEALSDIAAAQPAAAPTAEATATPAAAGSAAGAKVFKACKSCHNADKGGKNATGPNLWNVVGRDPGSVAGFAYSDAMKARAGTPWDATTLDAFLADPKGTVSGTKMAFAGVKKPEDRAALILWLTEQNDAAPAATEAAAGSTPDPIEAAAAAAPAGTLFADLADDTEVALDPVPYPEGVTYTNPPSPTDEEIAAIGARLDALQAELPRMDYQRARFNPIHFPPEINTASNAECLVCHQEIVDHNVREASIAGVKAADSLAWYQTLDTYAQDQADFHWRHLQSDFAKKVMNLDCVFCHKGNDPRDETPWLMAGKTDPNAPAPQFTARKMVNPSETCLLCHGQFPAANMGLEGTWPELRADLETPEAPNGCLSCHAESFRTNRHAVTYLNAANIEEAARAGTSDTCYGCHGGRAWYRTSYPYPRHPWPMMDTETTPDWAKDRPTASKPEYQLPPTTP